MTKIKSIYGKEILDSRGNPTVSAVVTLESGVTGMSAVPSGASTGAREAVELRDKDARYGGKGVLKAVGHVNDEIAKAVVGMDVEDQAKIDALMCELDGSENKGNFGANALLAVSLAALHASAAELGQEVFQRVASISGNSDATELPAPMLNILNGGAHAAGSTDFQEFMVVPLGFDSFSEALRAGAEIYHKLESNLHGKGMSTNVGFEGGFAPPDLTNRQALEYVTGAIESAGYKPGEQVFIALDPAASEFFDKDAGKYNLAREGDVFDSDRMIEEYETFSKDFPIYSIEDGLAEDDWSGWSAFTKKSGASLQLVGDDLYVTQERYLRRGIEESAGNAILIKLNQVGTVTETLKSIQVAREAGYGVVVSHRSGETEDTTIADLAVGVSSGQIKTGAPARSERVAKYNRLLRIEDMLGADARYAAKRVLR